MRASIEEYKAVEKAAMKFVQSVAEGNSKYAKELFINEAVLFGYLNGQMEHGSIEQFYQNVDNTGADSRFKARIDVIDVEETLAVVRVLEENWGGHIDFTDYLLLMKINGEWKTAQEADQNLLRSAKSLADKPDIAYISLPVRDSDSAAIETYLSKGFTRAPNVVRHIYKVRRGKIHGVKLFQYFDFATCRVEDCFVTDKKGIMLDVVDTNIEVILDQTQEEEEAKPFEF